MAKSSAFEVGASSLRWKCDPDALGFETSSELDCCRDIIGQERAINAIKLGLEIGSRGYNIYVSGLTGTGKSTTIKQLLQSMRKEKKDLQDLCYVFNFRSPEMPMCICLAAQQGVAFKRSMSQTLDTLRKHIPEALESDMYLNRHKEILSSFKELRDEIATELEKIIGDTGFQLVEMQYGPFTQPVVMPVIEGQALEMDKLPALVEAGKLQQKDFERIHTDYGMLMERMQGFLKQSRNLDRELADKISALEKQFVDPIIDACIKEVEEKFDHPKVRAYLRELREYCTENLDQFKDSQEEAEQKQRGPRKFLEFEVNVIVDNSKIQDVPVITETAPNYANLFGTVERISGPRGEYQTDLTMIRAGSLLRANGGYLVLSLTDIIEEPAVWPTLKRALKNQKVAIQSFDSLIFMPISALKPEPIDIDVKVVLIGDAYSYHILYEYDEDFGKIFKVKADFDTVMPNDKENLGKYCQFVRNICEEEGLHPFHKSAVAAVIEEGARLAGRQDKLSTRFSDVADVLREADYWARKDGAEIIGGEHVEKALEERIHRVNLIEEKIREMITDGTILLDIDGTRVGQVNGLSVYDLGDYAFGRPGRITVETAVGRAGVINIEREADLSGKTHNKGVLILEGYLRRKYAQDKPIAMSASICFEQSYSGIDGDSASSTEVYALLSSLSGLPLRQDLAVTGSVNQKGEIQPIGGVNEKVEGFYDVCRVKGLTGKQGVIIPKLNLKDLMLRKDVVASIEGGKFHLYAVESIDEGIELLTGVRAGKQLADGGFEKGSVHDRANEKLGDFAEHLRDFSEEPDGKE